MLAYQPSLPRDHTPFRRRASGLALAVVVNVLLLFVLLGIGRFAPGVQKPSDVIVLELPRGERSAPADSRPKAERQAKARPRTEARPLPKPPPIALPSKPTIEQPRAPAWIEMSKADMASADISNLARSSGGGASGDSEEIGKAPNGDSLYAAEWARRPTNAELAGYLPDNAPDGYGLVACKTLPDNRVDDCVELENYPRGSHLARAVRLAAWQFRVRPPRKNGRPLVGSWVRIEIDYSAR